MLKTLMQSNRIDAWQRVADQIGGKVIGTGLLQKSALVYDYKHWELVVDQDYGTNDHKTTTRIRVGIINETGLRLRFLPENVLSRLGKMVGLKDIQIGDGAFDDTFLISGNQKDRIQALFADETLRRLLLKNPSLLLFIVPEQRMLGLIPWRHKGHVELNWPKTVVNEQQLIDGIQMITHLLDVLAAQGIAATTPTKFSYARLY